MQLPVQSNEGIACKPDVSLAIESAIQEASSQYFRLVILAGLPGSGKTATLQSIGHRLG